MERHGEEPRVIKCKTRRDELATISEQVAGFVDSERNTLGIVCKTQMQAQRVADALTEEGHKVQLLSEQSRRFSPGVIVCTAHMSKGLEFDRVVVPGGGAKNYHTPMDRNLLYVACTRAMHRLMLTHTGDLTPLLQPS